MEIKAETKVGFFVFLSATIAVIFILSIGGSSFKKSYTYHAFFADVSGLKLKTPVKYGGRSVGVVDNIEFVDFSSDTIYRVDFKVERQIKIRSGSKASIATSGFIGDAFLSISPGKEKKSLEDNDTTATISPDIVTEVGEKDKYLKDNATLETEKSIGLSEIMKLAQDAVGRIDSALNNILGEESSDKVAKILENVNDASADLKILVKKAHSIVDEGKPHLTATTENLEDFSGNLMAIVRDNKDDIRKTITNLKGTSQALNDRVDPILVKLDGLITELKQISGDNKGDIRVLIQDLNATGKNFKEFSEDIKKNPWKLLAKPRQKKKK